MRLFASVLKVLGVGYNLLLQLKTLSTPKRRNGVVDVEGYGHGNIKDPKGNTGDSGLVLSQGASRSFAKEILNKAQVMLGTSKNPCCPMRFLCWLSSPGMF